MEMASVSSNPHSIEEIFKDYSDRHSGIIRALTYDVDEFYSLCDPESVLVREPGSIVGGEPEEVLPELPEPVLGINFAMDGMNRKDWLSLVAMHSDSWLLSVAFYQGAPFNHNER
ncbi:unnamed protein product [Victoria cruziana]